MTPDKRELVSPSIDFNSIPEYFAKPGIVEALAEAHPVLLIRQMANEILRLRSVPSARGEAPQKLFQQCARHLGANWPVINTVVAPTQVIVCPNCLHDVWSYVGDKK
jgi:hypothetical protein